MVLGGRENFFRQIKLFLCFAARNNGCFVINLVRMFEKNGDLILLDVGGIP